jgi:hypothetical protein
VDFPSAYLGLDIGTERDALASRSLARRLTSASHDRRMMPFFVRPPRLYLFGSTGRGEAREDLDVDLFFDHRKGELGLSQPMDITPTASVRQLTDNPLRVRTRIRAIE